MKLSKPAKRMILVICGSSLVFMGAGAVYYRSLTALFFALGVALAMGMNSAKVVMIERAVDRTAEIEEKKEGRNYVRFQYILRILLTGAILGISVAVATECLWGAIAGVFTFQIAAYSLRFMKLDEDSAPADPVSHQKEGDEH